MNKVKPFTEEIKQKWIAALESGNYIQGEGSLVYEEKGVKRHCCLGVLGDVCDFLDNTAYLPTSKTAYSYLPSQGINTDPIWEANDFFDKDWEKENPKRDYSNVLPLIRKLETV